MLPLTLSPRTPPRPLALQQPNYDQLFDYDTLIYDAFYRNNQLILISPPLSKRNWDFIFENIKCDQKSIIRKFFSPIQLYQTSGIGKAIIKSNHKTITLFAQKIERFESKIPLSHQNVLYSLQKNNKIEWINEWIDWHVKTHGVQAVVIYDNNSDQYALSDLIEKTKRSDDVVIIIASCPFKHGPSKWEGGKDDSTYLQTAMLEHVRYKYCHPNTKLMQCDIDELVITKGQQSIFKLCNSKNAVYTFPGHWIELPQQQDPATAQYMDHQYVDLSRFCPNKWVAHLEDMPHESILNIHGINGYKTSEQQLLKAKFLHFRCISTNWKYKRQVNSSFKHDQFIQLDWTKADHYSKILF